MKELYRFRQYLTEGVIKEEQMGSYKKFLKVVKSYEDEEILSDFLDSYPKGQDISKSEYERFTEKHLGLSDPEDYRGENWKYIMSEGKLLKEELRDVEDILVKAGFRFDDGILGGVGSGGAGYYDLVNDAIYGYDQSGPWNEEEFNKFYDNFEFNSNLYDREDLEDLEISQPQLEKGIYAVEDMGYVEIHSNGDVEIYATPQLSDEEGREFLPAFKMDANGKPIPQFSKDEMRKMLKDDMMYIL